MESIEEVNRRFNAELQRQVNGTLPLGHIYQLGRPGAVLRSAGFPDLPIEMAAVRLRQKSNQENHPFTLSEVKNMAYHLNNPVAIFQYENESKNVIVDIEHEDKHFLIGIHFNRDRRGIKVSDVRGLFPKDDIKWMNWIQQEKADYLNKEKIQILIDKRRTNFAEVTYLNLDSLAKVVQNFQNPPLKQQKIMEQSDLDLSDLKKDGKRCLWYGDQLTDRYSIKNGELEGLCETWYPNGQMEARMNFKNGKLDGLCETWHPDGKREGRSYYKDGELHGLSKVWDRNGKLIERAIYKEGIRASDCRKETVLSKLKRGLGL